MLKLLWKVRGKTVGKLRFDVGITSGLYTAAGWCVWGVVDFTGRFAVIFSRFLRDFSTAIMTHFISVNEKVFRTIHKTYNNNEFFLNNLLIIVRRAAI